MISPKYIRQRKPVKNPVSVRNPIAKAVKAKATQVVPDSKQKKLDEETLKEAEEEYENNPWGNEEEDN